MKESIRFSGKPKRYVKPRLVVRVYPHVGLIRGLDQGALLTICTNYL